MRFVIAAAVALASITSATAQSPADWDKTVAAAKAEGVVNFYTGLPGNPTTKKINDAFEKKYGIRMQVLELRATELRERIRAERVGNNATADVMHTSANQIPARFRCKATTPSTRSVRCRSTATACARTLLEGWVDRDINIPTFYC